MSEKAGEDKSLLSKPLPSGLLKESLPTAEEAVLSFWKENGIFEKSLAKNAGKRRGLFGGKKEFVFYEGPPTANARPGIHHLISRAFKDVILRYKTMQGFHVPRRGGWDTHGLPVELEVEKKLGFSSKKDIENYGIARFNEECRKNVGTYIDEWRKFTDRIGYWLDQDNAYFTYTPQYIESVWNIISQAHKKDLLYKDYKVVPWCPRCGTGLSSHELAQGYKDVKDLSVYVKFPVVGEPNTFFLAWTTTPWTLVGHLALAVGENIDYVKVKSGEDFFILAEARLSVLGDGYEIIKKSIKGKELIGTKYLPPYTYLETEIPRAESGKLEKAFKVYSADFVNTEDGTGIVHTAVMYGQDDFELGTKIGLPKHHMVDETGHFVKGTGFLEGRFVKDEETDVEIIKDLAHRNLLFKKEKYEHSYPHCWRCGTPLIYYARDSWYVRMSKLRDALVSENKKIHWEPEHIRDGRFGEWLADVKDWAISRERYWGTPLPVWESADGDRIVVDSIETLKKYSKKSGNRYMVMRHGGTEGNAHEKVSFAGQEKDHLTDVGQKQAEKAARDLKGKNVELIFVSPFARTKETAEIVRKGLGLAEENVIEDARLIEINPGIFDGKNWNEYHNFVYRQGDGWFTEPIPQGESFVEVRKRVGEFLYELERKYKDKNILIVTHGAPAWLCFVNAGLFTPTGKEYQPADTRAFIKEFKRFDNAEVRELPFVPLPHDENFSLDLHKPYIDEIVLEKDNKEYRRVKEVMDVWLDAGSMPFAQVHFPFDTKNIAYPADYICEGVDQTRGWFYTLHAVGMLMDRGRAYKNVICLGHILDKEGKKMSKSIGNTIDPWEAAKDFGVDALRFWMFAVKEPGEPKNFDPESVRDMSRKVFGLATNVLSFYEMYKVNDEAECDSENVLDRWIMVRLAELSETAQKNMDEYRILEAARAVRDFIGDLSQWYVRRSRERFKGEGDDARAASRTTRYVLHALARIMAPMTPFYAEALWASVKGAADPESVHLADWPAVPKADMRLIQQMRELREIVSHALLLRSRAGIKIRQPLKELRIKDKTIGSNKELVLLIKDELNVKNIAVDETLTEKTFLVLEITPELKAEGEMRELLRNIQEKRKEAGFSPKDEAKVVVSASSSAKNILMPFEELIKKQGNIKELVWEDSQNDEAQVVSVEKS